MASDNLERYTKCSECGVVYLYSHMCSDAREAGGPGTILHIWLARLGFENRESCMCTAIKHRMNILGDGCIDHCKELGEAIERSAARYGVAVPVAVAEMAVRLATYTWRLRR